MEQEVKSVNGWDSWKHHVLSSLDRNENHIEGLNREINQLSRELSVLSARIKTWGMALILFGSLVAPIVQQAVASWLR